MNSCINQHYVPQFYLRYFSNNKKNIGMFRFKNNLYVDNASIKSIAYKKNLYGEDGKIEQLLSISENDWNKTIKKFINLDFDKINNIDYKNLLQFITVSDARSNKLANEQIVLASTLKKLFNGFDDNEYFKSIKIMEQLPNLLPITIAYQNIDYISDLSMIILINKTVHKFITSDNIVAKYNQLYKYRKYPLNFGLGSSGLQIFIALSPEIVICLYDGLAYKCVFADGIIRLNDKKIINAINKLMIHNADEAIFYNGIDENKIRTLVKGKKHMKPEDSVGIFEEEGGDGLLIHTHSVNVKEHIEFNIFKITEEYMKISFPKHAGGLVRPHCKKIDKLKR